MLRGLYSAANAMQHRAHEVEITANNIANVSTDGYKQDRAALRSFADLLIHRIEQPPEDPPNLPALQPGIGIMDLGGPLVETEYIDFSAGPPRETGNPLDLYISGQGFFVMETPYGDRYTRAGNFSIDAGGVIVNPSGYALQGTNGGEIRIVSPSPIQIDQNGQVSQDGLPIAEIRIVEFSNLQVLEKEGETLFKMIDANLPGPQDAVASSVEQGYIEGSNVSVVNSLVQLIVAQRAYEAAARAVDMFNQSLAQVTGELGRLPG